MESLQKQSNMHHPNKNTGLNDLISYVASFPSNIVPLGHERKIGFFVFKTIFDCQILKLFIGHIQKAD